MPKSDAVRLISEFKTSLRAGGSAGDPGATGGGEPADLSEATAIAASLTKILENING